MGVGFGLGGLGVGPGGVGGVGVGPGGVGVGFGGFGGAGGGAVVFLYTTLRLTVLWLPVVSIATAVNVCSPSGRDVVLTFSV